jgi:hypothetical protein
MGLWEELTMLLALDHEYGLLTTLPLMSTEQGPSSSNSPIMEVEPVGKKLG